MNRISQAKAENHEYDPNVWGDCVDEAVWRVSHGYYCPYHLLRYIVDFAERIDEEMARLRDIVMNSNAMGFQKKKKGIPVMAITTERRKIEFDKLQFGDRILLDLKLNPETDNYGWPENAWGHVCDTHTPGQLGLKMEGLPIPENLRFAGGLMLVLKPENMIQVLEHEQAV